MAAKVKPKTRVELEDEAWDAYYKATAPFWEAYQKALKTAREVS